MKIGDRIKSRREELKMSQDDLAKKMGYKSRSSVNKIENGTTRINQDKIVEFAEVLDTSVSYLMGWENKYIQDHSRVHRNYNVEEKSVPYTIAAHHDGDEWTKEELEDIEMFKELLRMKRDKK